MHPFIMTKSETKSDMEYKICLKQEAYIFGLL